MVVGTHVQNDHSDDPSDDHSDDHCSDHHDVDMNTTECSKKKRNRNDKAIVIFEDDEIVYDKAAEKLKKKMNMVANDFKLLPMEVPWNQQDVANTKKAIETIQEEFHFIGTNKAYRYINETLNKLWRSAYNALLTKYDNKNLSIDEVMETLPYYVIKDQFRNKLIEKRSERGMFISEINRNNREKQTNHSLGSKILSKRNYEGKQKGKTKVEIWKDNVLTAYPKDKRVDKMFKWLKSEEAIKMTEQESMSEKDLFKCAITKHIGKNTKSSRTIGTTGSSLSKQTTHRMNIDSTSYDKGKAFVTDNWRMGWLVK